MREIDKLYPLSNAVNITHLNCLFYYKSPRNYKFWGEKHDFWEMVYVDNGKMLISADNNQYILSAGELIFHKPGEFHALSAYENSPANYIVTGFVCESAAMQLFENRILSLNSAERDCLYNAVRHGQNLFGKHDSPYLIRNIKVRDDFLLGEPQLVRLHLEMFIIRLLQRKESIQIEQRIETYVQLTRHKKLTEKVINYLNVHLAEPLTLSQISNHLGYSVSQIERLFSQETGRSIIDFFLELKMDEAKRMLKEGTYNISQISEHLGFSSISYFSRLFKLRYNITPSEFSRCFEE